MFACVCVCIFVEANKKIMVIYRTLVRSIANCWRRQADRKTNHSMKIIVHWTKVAMVARGANESYKRSLSSNRCGNLFPFKRQKKKSIKKIYVCTYLWIKKFLSESATLADWVSFFQIIRVVHLFPSGQLQVPCRLLFFSRGISNSN